MFDQISTPPVCRHLSDLDNILVGKVVPLQWGGQGFKPQCWQCGWGPQGIFCLPFYALILSPLLGIPENARVT